MAPVSRPTSSGRTATAARLTARVPVSTVYPRPSDAASTLSLPVNVQAYVETPIYARTSGYLKKWYVDIGGKVRAGRLLAEIETPEIDEELRQAEAAEAEAAANLDLAKKTAVRWQNLLKVDGVSQQEVDQNVSAYRARQADLAAQANAQRLKDMQSFQKVVAPFAGIITARNVDVGALISPSNPQPLFKLADTHILRVCVNVPQPCTRSMVPGLAADLSMAEFPHQTFAGKVARTAGAIDPASRSRQSGNRPVAPPVRPSPFTSSAFTLPLDASYEADVWGRARRSLESSQAQAQASAADYQNLLLTLRAEVAQDYYYIRYLDDDRAILRDNIELLKRALQLTEVRHAGGAAAGRNRIRPSTRRLHGLSPIPLDLPVLC